MGRRSKGPKNKLLNWQFGFLNWFIGAKTTLINLQNLVFTKKNKKWLCLKQRTKLLKTKLFERNHGKPSEQAG